MTKTPEQVDKHVGTKVRARRQMLGLSQEKLADELGLTFQQVQKYEKGMNRISCSRLQQIAIALRTPAAWFFQDLPQSHGDVTKGAPTTAPLDQFMTLPHASDMVKAYALMTNQQRTTIAAVAMEFAHANQAPPVKPVDVRGREHRRTAEARPQ